MQYPIDLDQFFLQQIKAFNSVNHIAASSIYLYPRSTVAIPNVFRFDGQALFVSKTLRIFCFTREYTMFAQNPVKRTTVMPAQSLQHHLSVAEFKQFQDPEQNRAYPNAMNSTAREMLCPFNSKLQLRLAAFRWELAFG